MKRFTFILLSLSTLFVLAFTSCGDTIYEVVEVKEVRLETRNIHYSVKANHWTKTYDDQYGEYWFCEFKEPLLTQYVFDKGIKNIWLLINGELNPLPFSDFWMDQYGYRWQEQVSCALRPGMVTFILKIDDFAGGPYYDYNFVLELAW